MAENPYLKSKMKRLKWMFNYIKTHSPIEYKKVIATMELNFGVSAKTVKGYIETLNDLESIEIKRGKIIVKEKR